jgi:hypothetical protein
MNTVTIVTVIIMTILLIATILVVMSEWNKPVVPKYPIIRKLHLFKSLSILKEDCKNEGERIPQEDLLKDLDYVLNVC